MPDHHDLVEINLLWPKMKIFINNKENIVIQFTLKLDFLFSQLSHISALWHHYVIG